MGNFDAEHPWELCTTLAGSWGYRPNSKVKPLKDIIRLLVSVVGRDGNLLLNVGPRADGQIEQDQIDRLREVGDWLKQYGQSVYATRGGPYLPGDFGVSTYHDNTIYLHILKRPGNALVLPGIPAKVLGCSVLTGGRATCTQTDTRLEVELTGNPEAVDTIVALTLASPASGIKTIPTPVTLKEQSN